MATKSSEDSKAPEDVQHFGDGVDAPAKSASGSGASDEGSSSEGGEQPKKRRRRRRRRSGGGTNEQPQGGGNNSGGGGNSRGRRRRGGGNSGGGGGRSGGNGQRRTRTISAEAANIEGTLEGVLELHPKGYGFLRDPNKNYSAQDIDAFVSSSLVEKYKLREGVLVRGDVGPGSRGQGPRLKTVEAIDNYSVEEFAEIKDFEDLTPINPFEQIRLETGQRPVTMRVMDLLTPIGKGQRALLVAPPRTGKTMLLQDIAASVAENHPEVHLMVLLIDERPEEVTEMRRNVKGEVIASSLDRDVESHVRISRLIVERAKRLAEYGKDVFILMDSITRMARAFNKWVGNSGRTGTGGLDIRALDLPKKLFGTARRFEEGGSLTVVGTALIDTGSRMDEAIFQEFKGTGNMEMVLSRDLADRRIWPSIDITKSGTRREEKILDPEVLDGVTLLRRSLISLSAVEAMEQLTATLLKFQDNKEFLSRIKQIL
ncbi:MAG: transcription termination factor Rho [Planctomycetaceae bacterium]